MTRAPLEAQFLRIRVPLHPPPEGSLGCWAPASELAPLGKRCLWPFFCDEARKGQWQLWGMNQKVQAQILAVPIKSHENLGKELCLSWP